MVPTTSGKFYLTPTEIRCSRAGGKSLRGSRGRTRVEETLLRLEVLIPLILPSTRKPRETGALVVAVHPNHTPHPRYAIRFRRARCARLRDIGIGEPRRTSRFLVFAVARKKAGELVLWLRFRFCRLKLRIAELPEHKSEHIR